MATKGEMFAGLTVALVTPFKNGEVDHDALGRLVDWHIEQGTDCLAPVGTTGESPTLDHAEHERIIAAVVERARGRIKVMPGTGSNSTREALRLTKFAKRAGANGALMVGPYYNKPTQEGYYRHFAAVAEAVDLPIVLYNIPGRTGSNILPETIARLTKLDMHCWWKPTATSYFAHIPKARIIEVIASAVSADVAAPLIKLPKGLLVQEAEKLVAPSDWLPELLRPTC